MEHYYLIYRRVKPYPRIRDWLGIIIADSDYLPLRRPIRRSGIGIWNVDYLFADDDWLSDPAGVYREKKARYGSRART